jgi:uncharacterized lipoprotein YbaY
MTVSDIPAMTRSHLNSAVMARLQQIALFAHAVCLMNLMRLANRDKPTKCIKMCRSRIRLQTCFSKVTSLRP